MRIDQRFFNHRRCPYPMQHEALPPDVVRAI